MTYEIRPADPAFLGLPSKDMADLAEGDIAILGIPEATPYTPGQSSHCADAPGAMRAAIAKYTGSVTHHDFDTSTTLIPPDASLFDLGNLAGDPNEPAENRAAIREAISAILERGAVPLVIGGDDSVPIPLLQAYQSQEPFWLVQIDAHIDWRDEREGEREGWSSTMRRASELPCIEGIVQVGIRGVGSARPEEVEAAGKYGAHFLLARDVHENGVGALLDAIPEGARCFITLDYDALDPAVMPAVLTPVPGGLTYWQTVDVIQGLAQHTSLVGADLVELCPRNDASGLGALTAGRIANIMLHALSGASSSG